MTARFGAFRLDTATREVARGGDRRHLSTKAFDLLALLIARHPAVVGKAEIRQHLWPDTHVVDASLANLVTEIRRALDDDPGNPAFVRTVHGVGYAFAGAIVRDATDARDPAAGGTAAPACWLSWKGREFGLAMGDHVIGRDPASAVRIDADGVSRRHAQVSVRVDGRATRIEIRDLASTNGTFVRDRAATESLIIGPGDEIRLGDEILTVRLPTAADAPTRRVRNHKR